MLLTDSYAQRMTNNFYVPGAEYKQFMPRTVFSVLIYFYTVIRYGIRYATSPSQKTFKFGLSEPENI